MTADRRGLDRLGLTMFDGALVLGLVTVAVGFRDLLAALVWWVVLFGIAARPRWTASRATTRAKLARG